MDDARAMMADMDRSAQMEYAKRQAYEEGYAQSYAKVIGKSIEQCRLNIVRHLKEKGIADEVISHCTGLTLEQIAEL